MPSSPPSGRPIRATARSRPRPADDLPVDVFLDGYEPPIRELAQGLRAAVLRVFLSPADPTNPINPYSASKRSDFSL